MLNGGGQGNTLNATFSVDYGGILPTVNNIPTANFTSLVNPTGIGVNAARFSGLTSVGNIDSAAPLLVSNLGALSTVNVVDNIGTATTLTANATALSGAADTVALNLSNTTGNGVINLSSAAPSATNGYETINVTTIGANSIGQILTNGSADNITVSGAGLTIAGTAAAPIDNTVASFNAGAMTGSLTLGSIGGANASVLDASGASLNFVGSNNGTTVFAESLNLGANDTLAGGTGAADTLVLTGANGAVNNVVQANGGSFSATGFETLRISDTNGNGATNATAFNLINVRGLNTIQLNGGNSANVVTLNNVNYTVPLTVTNTGNRGTGAQTINGLTTTLLGAFGAANTLNYTFANQGVASTGAITSGALNFAGVLNTDITNLNMTISDLGTGSSFTVGAAGGGADVVAADNANFSLTAAAGPATAGTIALNEVGVAGTNDIARALINSAAGVSGTYAQAAGAVIATQGAGNHTVIAGTAGNALTINGSLGTGAQTLTANDQNDQLVGGAGADTITGAAGADAMTGSGGADSFIWAAGASGQTAATADNILDYTGGTDVIRNAAGGGNAIGVNANAAVATAATISATGVAGFDVADDTFAERVAAVVGGLVAGAGGDVAGKTVVFNGGVESPFTYLFVSDGGGTVNANDYLVRLTGVNLTAAGLTITNGNVVNVA